jgi:hypothetical protein
MAPAAVLSPVSLFEFTSTKEHHTRATRGFLDTSNEVVADYAATEIRGSNNILSSQASSKVPFGDWRDDFFRNGYYVVKGAVPRERADSYRQRMLDWLCKFDFGFDINDKTTWVQKHLPMMMKGGMILNYCAAHEKWAWEARRCATTCRNCKTRSLVDLTIFFFLANLVS